MLSELKTSSQTKNQARLEARDLRGVSDMNYVATPGLDPKTICTVNLSLGNKWNHPAGKKLNNSNLELGREPNYLKNKTQLECTVGVNIAVTLS